MSRRAQNPPIICTDDGWILGSSTPETILQDIEEKVVGSYGGCPAALWWSVGDHDVYTYETGIGELIGDHPGSAEGIEARNVRRLIETSGGPLSALIPLCRDAGLPFFARLRMNSHYDIEPEDPLWSDLRRQHPEWCIGMPGSGYPVGSLEHGIRTGFDFRHRQVRDYRLAIIGELIERFDLDGLELDFMRHPAFFRSAEAYQHRHLMTDLIREVRRRLTASAARKGPLQLAVRVPATLADAARIGLDVARWMEEHLVDIVVVGGGFIPYETPIREFVDLAGDAIDVYGCIESTRYADEKNLRAIASHFYAGGARGVQLYNFYTKGAEWNSRVLNQLADPQALARLDKRYELDQTARFTTPYHCAFPVHNIEAAFRYASPPAQLPVALESTVSGDGIELTLEVADDLQTVLESVLPSCTLTLRFEGLLPDARIEAAVNDSPLSWTEARSDYGGWMRQEIEAEFWKVYPAATVEARREGASVAWSLDGSLLRRGGNRLRVGVAAGAGEPAVLTGVELVLEYESSR